MKVSIPLAVLAVAANAKRTTTKATTSVVSSTSGAHNAVTTPSDGFDLTDWDLFDTFPLVATSSPSPTNMLKPITRTKHFKGTRKSKKTSSTSSGFVTKRSPDPRRSKTTTTTSEVTKTETKSTNGPTTTFSKSETTSSNSHHGRSMTAPYPSPFEQFPSTTKKPKATTTSTPTCTFHPDQWPTFQQFSPTRRPKKPKTQKPPSIPDPFCAHPPHITNPPKSLPDP